jgi:hypothetical protein
MNQYLINLTTKTIVGRFAEIAEAEIAGELLLAPEPYDVRDQETLLSYSRDELRALLAGLGLEVKANWPKAQFVEKVCNMADAAEFAQINPPKTPEPEPVKKSEPKVKKESNGVFTRPGETTMCGKVWALYDSLQSGASRKEAIAAAVAMGVNPLTASTQYYRWTRK